MPTRRGIGQGLMNVADIVAGYARQKANDEDISRRQVEDDERGAALQKLMEQLKNADSLKTKFYADNPGAFRRDAGKVGLTPDESDYSGPVAGKIADAKTMQEAPTDDDIRGLYAARGGNASPTTALKGRFAGQDDPSALPSESFAGPAKLGGMNNMTKDRPAIETLLAQATAKRKAIEDELNKASMKSQDSVNPDGSKQTQFVNPRAGGTYTTGLSASQEGKNEADKKLAGDLSPEVTAAKATQEGAVTGAREKAQFPWQVKLAKVRADVQMQEFNEKQAWIAAHPKATAAEINKRDTATAGLGRIAEIRTMADEMDKRGLLGPIQGRLNDLASGKIKASALFNNPDDAKLVADYVASAKLLSSLVAVAHGGARGGGSVQMTAKFEQIFNGVGDKPTLDGQLDSLERLLAGYTEHPDQPQPYEIPALTNEVDTALEKLRSRKPMQPVPAHKVGG